MRKSKGKKVQNGEESKPTKEDLANDSGEDEQVPEEKVSKKRSKKSAHKSKKSKKNIEEGEDNDSTLEDEKEEDGDDSVDENQVEEERGSKKRSKKSSHKSPKKAKKSDDKDEDDSASDTEYEVERILELHTKRNGDREFLVRWKGYSKKDDTWEPEGNLNCPELIAAFLLKVEKAKEATQRETRIKRKPTDRYVINAPDSGRKLSARNRGPRRTYYNSD